jgi:hypothetical protein
MGNAILTGNLFVGNHLTAMDTPTAPVALSAIHGAAHRNVNLAIVRDFHAVDFDPFNIKRNRDILGHGTPRFKIALPGLATICLHWAYFLPFKFPKSQ